MLGRLAIFIFAPLGALCLVIVPGMFVISGHNQWARQRLHEVLTRQLAELLGREVAVGPLNGNLFTGLSIEGLAIAEHHKLSEGAVFTAQRIVLKYNLRAALRGEMAPLASVSLIEIWGAQIRLIRDPKGKFNLMNVLAPVKLPPEKRFRGRVRLHKAMLIYLDYGPNIQKAPLQLRMRDIEAQADLRQPTRLIAQATGTAMDGRARKLSARLWANLEGPPFSDVQFSLTSLDVGWLAQHIKISSDFTLQSGRADVQGALYKVRYNERVRQDYSVKLRLRHVGLKLQPPAGTTIYLKGELWASKKALAMRQLQILWEGNRYRISGSACNLQNPLLDVAITASNAHLTPLVNLLPPANRKDWKMAQASPANFRVEILGPAKNPDVRVQFWAPRLLTLWTKSLGKLKAHGLHVAAEIIAARKRPAIEARIEAQRLQMAELEAKGAWEEAAGLKAWPQQWAWGAVEDLRVTARFCGGHPFAQASLNLPYMTIGQLHAQNIHTEALYLDNVVRFSPVKAALWGGTLKADMTFNISPPTPSLLFKGQLQGMDLAHLYELPLAHAPENLQGSADVDFQGHFASGCLAVCGDFQAHRIQAKEAYFQDAAGAFGLNVAQELKGLVRVNAAEIYYKDVALSQAEALIDFQGPYIEVLSAYAQSPPGVLWARGHINPEAQTASLQVRGAELPVERLAETFRAGDDAWPLSGFLYGEGTLEGSWKDPGFAGKIVVFQPQWKEHKLAALSAQAQYTNATLSLRHLYFNRMSSIIQGELVLQNLRSPQEEIALSGDLAGEGVDLAELSQLFQWDKPVHGLGEFKAHLEGTLAEPRASGQIRLANVSYEDWIITSAETPFVWQQDCLHFEDIHAVMWDAPVRGQGSISFKADQKEEIEAYLSVQQLRLEGLAPYLDLDIPLGGIVSLPEAWLRGPVNNLQGEARLVAPEIIFGDETIKKLDAKLSLCQGRLELQETSFEMAAGRVTISGVYDQATEPAQWEAQARLQGTEISDLLYLAAPLVETWQEKSAGEATDYPRLLRSYALRLRGPLNGVVKLTGTTEAPLIEASVESASLAFQGQSLPELKAYAHITKDALTNLSLSLRQREALITAEGEIAFAGPVHLNIDGSAINMAQLRPWLPQDIPCGGRVGFSVVATGSTREPTLTASLDINEFNLAGMQFDVLSIPIATIREGEINIDTLLIKRGDTEIVLDGRLPFSWHRENLNPERKGPGLIPEGSLALGGRIQDTPPGFFLALLDEYLNAKRTSKPVREQTFAWASLQTSGKLNSAVTITGTVQEPILQGFVKLTEGSVSAKNWKSPINEVQGELRFSRAFGENRVEVVGVNGRYEHTQAELTGKIALKTFQPQDFWRKNQFDLKLAVLADRQPLPGGTELTGMQGTLTLQTEEGQQVVRPENFQAQLGGGRVQLTGEARLSDWQFAHLANNQYNLWLKMDSGRIRYRPYVDALASGHMHILTPAADKRARIESRWQLTKGWLGIMPGLAASEAIKALSSEFPAPEMDIVLALGPDMRLEAPTLRAYLQPNPMALHITGTPQAPHIQGGLAASRGTTILPTATLRVREFNIQYALAPKPGDLSDPVSLWLQGFVEGEAEKTISRPGARPIHIVVRLTGALPDRVKVTASSEPFLSESQIYALLGGVPFSYLAGAGESEGNVPAVMSEQFLSALATAFQLRVFQPLAEELEEALGLELGLSFAFNQPLTLQVGKYVLRNLQITYERPLSEGGSRYDIRLSYELPHGLQIMYHNDERNIHQIGIGYSVGF